METTHDISARLYCSTSLTRALGGECAWGILVAGGGKKRGEKTSWSDSQLGRIIIFAGNENRIRQKHPSSLTLQIPVICAQTEAEQVWKTRTHCLSSSLTHTRALGFLFPLIILRRACTSLSKEINAKAQEPQIHRHKRDNTSNSATCSITHSTREPACLLHKQQRLKRRKQRRKQRMTEARQKRKKLNPLYLYLPSVRLQPHQRRAGNPKQKTDWGERERTRDTIGRGWKDESELLKNSNKENTGFSRKKSVRRQDTAL